MNTTQINYDECSSFREERVAHWQLNLWLLDGEPNANEIKLFENVTYPLFSRLVFFSSKMTQLIYAQVVMPPSRRLIKFCMFKLAFKADD